MSLPELLAQIRQLTDRYKAGKDPDSFDAFRDLVNLLFSHTILEQGQAVRLFKGKQQEDSRVLGGWRPLEPLRLNNGRYLSLSMILYREETDKGPRIKMASSRYQYT